MKINAGLGKLVQNKLRVLLGVLLLIIFYVPLFFLETNENIATTHADVTGTSEGTITEGDGCESGGGSGCDAV